MVNAILKKHKSQLNPSTSHLTDPIRFNKIESNLLMNFYRISFEINQLTDWNEIQVNLDRFNILCFPFTSLSNSLIL